MFEVGRIYNRRDDLHSPYGGQQQGGISTPTDQPFIMLFGMSRKNASNPCASDYTQRCAPSGHDVVVITKVRQVVKSLASDFLIFRPVADKRPTPPAVGSHTNLHPAAVRPD